MPTLWLICEDEHDAHALKAILQKRGLEVRVERLAAKTVGGISRLPDSLPDLIALAKKRRQAGDCIAVLRDADELSTPNRALYERIGRICREHGVLELIAHDELEAWLLADSGLCAWLGIAPKSWDSVKMPAAELHSLMKRAQRGKYQGRGKADCLAHLRGDGDVHSASMQAALAHLASAGCLQ